MIVPTDGLRCYTVLVEVSGDKWPRVDVVTMCPLHAELRRHRLLDRGKLEVNGVNRKIKSVAIVTKKLQTPNWSHVELKLPKPKENNIVKHCMKTTGLRELGDCLEDMIGR